MVYQLLLNGQYNGSNYSLTGFGNDDNVVVTIDKHIALYLHPLFIQHFLFCMTKHHSYNHMNFRDRVYTSARLLGRARKQGVGQVLQVLVKQQPALYLGPRPALDGLSLYRQAVKKLEVPPAVADPRGKTIMLISHC